MLRVKRRESLYMQESGWYRGYASSLFGGDGAFFIAKVRREPKAIHFYKRKYVHSLYFLFYLADHKNKGEMNHGYERETSGAG